MRTNIKTTELLKEKEKDSFKTLKAYSDFIESYYAGVKFSNIENLLEEDYLSYINGKQSKIESKKDYDLAKKALLFLEAKRNYLEDYQNNKDTYYDKCIKQKEEFQSILDSGVSIDNIQAMLEEDFYKFYCNNEMSLEYIIAGAEAEAYDFDEVEIFALDGFSDEYNNPTGTKSYHDKEIKKLAFNLLKKEITNN